MTEEVDGRGKGKTSLDRGEKERGCSATVLSSFSSLLLPLPSYPFPQIIRDSKFVKKGIKTYGKREQGGEER